MLPIKEGKKSVVDQTVAYYLKSMLGLPEIRVSAAAHLLSNEASCWKLARSLKRCPATQEDKMTRAERAFVEAEVFKGIPNLEVAS